MTELKQTELKIFLAKSAFEVSSKFSFKSKHVENQSDLKCVKVLKKVKSIVFHPKFKKLTFKSIGYDVALLKLYNPVDFAANLVPICLPKNDNQLVDEIAWTKGFGALYEGTGLNGKSEIRKLNRHNHPKVLGSKTPGND